MEKNTEQKNNILHVGLDVGSTTVKIIVMDSNLNTIYEITKIKTNIIIKSNIDIITALFLSRGIFPTNSPLSPFIAKI